MPAEMHTAGLAQVLMIAKKSVVAKRGRVRVVCVCVCVCVVETLT